MKAFEMRDYNLQINPTVWGLLPFKALLKRDKSRNKEQAFKDMLFIYYYADIRSDYMYITDSEIRFKEIIKDIGLNPDFKIDKTLQEAIDFYNKFKTVIQVLYEDTIHGADGLSSFLRRSKKLLEERDEKGKPIYGPNVIAATIEKVPKLMRDLKAAEKEVIKEKQELEGRTQGSKSLGLFEDGFGDI